MPKRSFLGYFIFLETVCDPLLSSPLPFYWLYLQFVDKSQKKKGWGHQLVGRHPFLRIIFSFFFYRILRVIFGHPSKSQEL